MEFRFAVARIVTVAVLCISVFFGGGAQILYPKESIISSPQENTAILQKEDTVNSEQNPPQTENQSEDKNPSESESSESVPAASEGAVLGKVIERFISPYTANTSYNNVYLKNNTSLKIDLKEFLNAPLKFKVEKNGAPQVLIMHTHTTETFLTSSKDYYTDTDLSRTTDNSKNMAAIGKLVADKLNAAGIVTLHDSTQHDYPSYSGSYTRSAKTVSSYLKKYPDIKIVLDLHRDAIAQNDTDKVKLTADISGKKAAQVMLVMGAQTGTVKNFPNWKENLKLAVKLQQNLETMYPSLARSISLVAKNYNASLSTGSMLIEIGTDANSIEEVTYSAELLSNALINTFNNLG